MIPRPLCNDSSETRVWVTTTLHLPNSADGAYPEEECVLNPVKARDNVTRDCITKLKQRPDLTKIVILVHGWSETDEAFWMEDKHNNIDDEDPSAATIRVGWGPHNFVTVQQDFADARYVGKALGILLDKINKK